MQKEMFEFVRKELESNDSQGGISKTKINYDRFKHTKRVYHFVQRIYNELENNIQLGIDLEALEIAAIFHDAGYGQIERKEHAVVSEKLCRKYLVENKYESSKIDFICYLIANHSNKELLQVEDTPLELVLLLEADLLDDTGAHGIVMDVWVQSLNEGASFESMLEHIKKFTYEEMQNDPMRTEPARRIWNEKRLLTNEFIRQYEMDLEE